jgi:hypothetical protein
MGPWGKKLETPYHRLFKNIWVSEKFLNTAKLLSMTFGFGSSISFIFIFYDIHSWPIFAAFVVDPS